MHVSFSLNVVAFFSWAPLRGLDQARPALLRWGWAETPQLNLSKAGLGQKPEPALGPLSYLTTQPQQAESRPLIQAEAISLGSAQAPQPLARSGPYTFRLPLRWARWRTSEAILWGWAKALEPLKRPLHIAIQKTWLSQGLLFRMRGPWFTLPFRMLSLCECHCSNCSAFTSGAVQNTQMSVFTNPWPQP